MRMSLIQVHDCYQRDGSSYVVPDPAGTVWGAPLDDVLSRYPLRCDRIDAIKVDVEGADLHAIGGMAGLLARHRPVLVIEDHSPYGYYEAADLLALLARLGYEPEEVMPDGARYWLARPAPEC